MAGTRIMRRMPAPGRIALVVLLASMAEAAAALTVSVSPCGSAAFAPDEDGRGGAPYAYLTSGFMSVLFDSGYIATEARPAAVERGDWAASAPGLGEARSGRVDYLVGVYVDWLPSAFVKGATLPAALSYRVLRVSDGKLIGEGSIEGVADSEDAAAHLARSVALVGAKAASPCVKLLETLNMGGER